MKTAYLSDNNTLFEKYLSKYNELKEDFLKLTNGNMPDNYFVFDARFSLSCALNISFSKKIKSSAAKSCYSRLLKISNLWLTYDLLLQIAFEQGFFADKNAKAAAITDVQAAKIFEIEEILTNSNNQLTLHCFVDSTKEKKVKDYITFLAKDNTPSQVAILNRALFSLKSKNQLGIQEFTAWVYAIHNAFAEKGETSLSRIKNLELTKSLFEILYDYLLLTTIKIATKLIENKIEHLTT